MKAQVIYCSDDLSGFFFRINPLALVFVYRQPLPFAGAILIGISGKGTVANNETILLRAK